MISFTNTDVTYTFGRDSFFQKSPGGISYRIPKKWSDLFNKHILRIAENARDVAKSYTPFSNFRDSWAKQVTYGGQLGFIDSITIYNTRASGFITYKSKYSNSGKNYRFAVKRAIEMLEIGRAGGYVIAPRSSDTKALTLPPSWAIRRKGKSNRSKDGKTAFFAKVTGGALAPTKVLTNTGHYMKSAVEGLFSQFKSEGIENVVLSRVKPNQMGSYTKTVRPTSKNSRGKR